MADLKNKVKDKIDDTAKAAKRGTDKAADKMKEGAQKLGKSVQNAGKKIQEKGR